MTKRFTTLTSRHSKGELFFGFRFLRSFRRNPLASFFLNDNNHMPFKKKQVKKNSLFEGARYAVKKSHTNVQLLVRQNWYANEAASTASFPGPDQLVRPEPFTSTAGTLCNTSTSTAVAALHPTAGVCQSGSRDTQPLHPGSFIFTAGAIHLHNKNPPIMQPEPFTLAVGTLHLYCRNPSPLELEPFIPTAGYLDHRSRHSSPLQP